MHLFGLNVVFTVLDDKKVDNKNKTQEWDKKVGYSNT